LNGRASILVVDNNLADQELIREMLPMHGLDADLIPAMEGEEAIALLRGPPAGGRTVAPDAVLLDLNLSRVHGREVLAFIRGDASLRSVPVIVFTGWASDEVRRACLESGADAVLLKPRRMAGYAEVTGSLKHHLAGRGRARADGGPRP
jgi:CheY-like chemotaxis protein